MFAAGVGLWARLCSCRSRIHMTFGSLFLIFLGCECKGSIRHAPFVNLGRTFIGSKATWAIILSRGLSLKGQLFDKRINFFSVV